MYGISGGIGGGGGSEPRYGRFSDKNAFSVEGPPPTCW